MNSNDTHLDRLMTKLGLENHELAKLAGTKRQTIWKLRTGMQRMLPDWAKRLAPHLGVSWEELIEGPPTSVDKERAHWIALFDAMTEEQRRKATPVIEMLVRHDEPSQPHSEPSVRQLHRVGSGRS